jgi:hypothetical protein
MHIDIHPITRRQTLNKLQKN